MTHPEIHPRILLSGTFGDDLRVTLSDATARALEAGSLKLALTRQGAQPTVSGVDLQIGATGGNLVICIGHDDAVVRISEGVRGAFDLRLWRAARVEIGPNTTSNGTRIVCDNSSFLCGADVMFSDGVIVQTCDQHGIVDLRDGRIVNDHPATTVVGDHVWIGRAAKVMKGVTIGTGAIVGMASVVTRDVAPCTLVAGTPARTLRREVTWSRSPDRLDVFARRLVGEHRVCGAPALDATDSPIRAS